jgi:branched-chain amino acid transport system permease protein
MGLFVIQLLNGLQLGVTLFLMASGLTLVFGIMNFVNLAHGSFFMCGAYFAAVVFAATDSFLLAGAAAILGTVILGLLIEIAALSSLYSRDHLIQVLCTFGLILIFNELVQIVWGLDSLYLNVPQILSGTIRILGQPYPLYRAAVIVVGIAVAVALYIMIHRRRVGMLIRAGAFDPVMVSALGVNIKRLNTLVFAIGAGLAGLAGLLAAPMTSIQSGMGEPVLILTLVVIVTGGIGSIRGAFYGAIIVGIIDTIGRAFLPLAFMSLMPPAFAQSAGPAIASMLIYLLMAVILAFRPQGLFPVRAAA